MAPQRLRVGPGRGPAVLGVLVAVLLVTALVVAGRSQDRPGRPPSPVAGTTAALDAPYRLGGGWRWPLRLPVLAMADGHSYPSWHPTRPPAGGRAIACYQTPEDAAAAGYPAAPPPAGGTVIGGVYLVPTDRAFRARCQPAADRLGFAVPCPGLLPVPARGTAQPDLCGQQAPCVNGTGFILRQEEFQVPTGYFGIDKQARGALELTAFSARRPAGIVNFACETERRIATVAVQGTRAVPGVVDQRADDAALDAGGHAHLGEPSGHQRGQPGPAHRPGHAPAPDAARDRQVVSQAAIRRPTSGPWSSWR